MDDKGVETAMSLPLLVVGGLIVEILVTVLALALLPFAMIVEIFVPSTTA